MTYLNSYDVTVSMENNVSIIWEGYAEDESHAEGLAIAYATNKTGSQVDHIYELNEYDQFEVISENDAYDRYDEMIDDCHAEVEVFSYSYSPSHVLKTVDPIAYNCGFSDYVSQLESEEHILVDGFYTEN